MARMSVGFVKRIILLVLFSLVFNIQATFAQIGILSANSDENIKTQKSIDNYNQLWQDIVYVFNHINVKYSVFTEKDLNKLSIKNINILVLPLMTDVSQETMSAIQEYVGEGGKIIVIFPDDYLSLTTQKLGELAGVFLGLPQKITDQSHISLTNGEKVPENYFPYFTKVAKIELGPTSRAFAKWSRSEREPVAVSISPTGSYISWKWGNEGSIDFNTSLMRSLIKALSPGTIEKEQTAIGSDEFQKKIADIREIRKNADELIKYFLDGKSSKELEEISSYLALSSIQEGVAEKYYYANQYDKALEELKNAKTNLLFAYAKSAPANSVEGRTLWLDRGTIVAIKNPEEMANLFERIKQIGINAVYFETLNAGFTIYPSKITSQNPFTKGWDPLYWAVKEAHKRGIEVHAWAWIFAVGNSRHNTIIGLDQNYPGPIIPKYPNLALRGPSDNLLPQDQYEFWLDPSNYKARNLITSILVEIAKKYPVDGIQYDYIRYPVQNQNNLMGFNYEGRKKFEIESGLKLDKIDNATLKTWNEWKARQINKFVAESARSLRKINPNILISAAVYPGDRQSRMNSVQQDWETWVDKGWIDILNPMIYSSNLSKLEENLDYIVKNSGNKVPIYPGIAVRQLEASDLLEQIFTVKEKYGMVGNTIFAMAHLAPDKSEFLSSGPYKVKDTVSPLKNPLNASESLIEQYITIANSVKQNTLNTAEKNYFSEKLISEAYRLKSAISDVSRFPTDKNFKQALAILANLEILTETNNLTSVKSIQLMSGCLKGAQTLLLYEKCRKSRREANGYALTNTSNGKV